jgi:hypothetical protein
MKGKRFTCAETIKYKAIMMYGGVEIQMVILDLGISRRLVVSLKPRSLSLGIKAPLPIG